MKHLFNNLSQEEKKTILEQHSGKFSSDDDKGEFAFPLKQIMHPYKEPLTGCKVSLEGNSLRIETPEGKVYKGII
jgi:hypothetical protein